MRQEVEVPCRLVNVVADQAATTANAFAMEALQVSIDESKNRQTWTSSSLDFLQQIVRILRDRNPLPVFETEASSSVRRFSQLRSMTNFVK